MMSKFLFLALMLFISEGTAGATVSIEDVPLKVVLIEGEIVEGDYEKFVELVLQYGAPFGKVYIASRGGNVSEAIKIGKLIRQLRFETWIPERRTRGGIDGFCREMGVRKENCKCLSACFLIFASGIYRFGSYIGLHRAFLNHDELKSMSMDDAERYARVIDKNVGEYLSEMDISKEIQSLISSIPSNQIQELPSAYVSENLMGFATSFQEWFIANCGDAGEMLDEWRLKSNSPSRKDELGKMFDDALNCIKELKKTERYKAFYPAISKAIKTADQNRFPRYGLVKNLTVETDFDIGNFIGLKNIDVFERLKLFGFVDYSRSEEDILKIFDQSGPFGPFRMDFDSKGLLTKLTVHSWPQFSGLRMNELISVNSKLEDFVKVYGAYEAPNYDSLARSGLHTYNFISSKYSLQAVFNGNELAWVVFVAKEEEKPPFFDWVDELLDKIN